LTQHLKAHPKGHSAEQIAHELNASPETVFKICEHLAANKSLKKIPAKLPFAATYRAG
jgi:Mn-dependent DtxR family transcriptional regulator